MRNKIILTIREMKQIYADNSDEPAKTITIQGTPIVVWYLGFLIREFEIVSGLPDEAVVEFSGQGESEYGYG